MTVALAKDVEDFLENQVRLPACVPMPANWSMMYPFRPSSSSIKLHDHARIGSVAARGGGSTRDSPHQGGFRCHPPKNPCPALRRMSARKSADFISDVECQFEWNASSSGMRSTPTGKLLNVTLLPWRTAANCLPISAAWAVCWVCPSATHDWRFIVVSPVISETRSLLRNQRRFSLAASGDPWSSRFATPADRAVRGGMKRFMSKESESVFVSIRIVATMAFPTAKNIFPMCFPINYIILASFSVGCFQNGKLKVHAVIRTRLAQQFSQVLLFRWPLYDTPSTLPDASRSISAADVMPSGFGIGDQVDSGHAR